MSNIESKAWGTTKQIIVTPFMELHHIYVKPSSYCSEHIHKFKSNLFYCLKGAIRVKVWKSGGIIDDTLLTPGQSTAVGPGEKHQFYTERLFDIQQHAPDFKEDDMVEVLEAYYPEPINKLDITRYTAGGSLYTV